MSHLAAERRRRGGRDILIPGNEREAEKERRRDGSDTARDDQRRLNAYHTGQGGAQQRSDKNGDVHQPGIAADVAWLLRRRADFGQR